MSRSARLLRLVLIFALALAALPTRTLAQGAGPTDAQRTRARELYGAGQSSFDAQRYEEALESFEAAYREVPNPVVLLGVASAQERLGRREDAARTLRRYLRERPDAPDRASVESRIAEFDPTGATREEAPAPTGTVRVVGSPEGAAIAVDGQDTGLTVPADVVVPEGEHTVTVSHDGHASTSEVVSVRAGATQDVAVALEASAITEDVLGEQDAGPLDTDGEDGAPAPVPTAADEDPSTAVWVTSAIAGVGLVTGTVFGFMALSAQSDFDAAPTADAADRGETYALVADLSLGVALAAGVTAIVLYATGQSRPETGSSASTERPQGPRLAVTPWGGPNGGGAAMRLEF